MKKSKSSNGKNLSSCLLIIAILLFFPIVAIWWIWTKSKWTPKVKWIATGVIAALFIIIAIAGGSSSSTQTAGNTTNKTSPSVSTSTSNQNQTANQSQDSRYVPSGVSKTSNCQENNGLPDSACTPGATDSRVTQANIQSTICVSGYTTTVRPPTSYTNPLKTSQIQEYGYSDTNLSDYEEDHLIPLEVGGSPTDPANLWPEPYNITYGSKQKDKVENYLHDQVCGGSISLADAQKEIAQNWENVYNSHYGTLSPSNSSSTTPTAPVATPPASNIPSGATGRCNDGTYTYATNHQGACSHHGGVAEWY
jgi:hypothetical protein